MNYYMPTKIIEEDNVVLNHSDIFGNYGKKALIVTGRNSAKINGAQKDVVEALDRNHVDYVIFDQVIENPPIELVAEGAKVGFDCDFVIGIGGGSPIDAAKAMAVLIKNPTDAYFDMLYKTNDSEKLPLIAIPTTGGTGTETTPYAILTDHDLGTKTTMAQRVFPEVALLDVKYYMHMPVAIRNNTCVDALTHSIESYMNAKATKYSDYIALESIRLWGEHKEALKGVVMEVEAMKAFMSASTLAGIAISQTGTSIPHTMGYPLTYNYGVAHGKANGLFMASYLNLCSNKWKVANIMDLLGFESLQAFDGYLKEVIGTFELKESEMDAYAELLMSNTRKLKNHPDPITKEDIVGAYRDALGIVNE